MWATAERGIPTRTKTAKKEGLTESQRLSVSALLAALAAAIVGYIFERLYP